MLVILRRCTDDSLSSHLTSILSEKGLYSLTAGSLTAGSLSLCFGGYTIV